MVLASVRLKRVIFLSSCIFFLELPFFVNAAPTTSAVTASSHALTVESAYPSGDFYFLISDLEPSYRDMQTLAFLKLLPELTDLGYRVILNTAALEVDLREALANPRTKTIFWSGHGHKLGGLGTVTGRIGSDYFHRLERDGSLKGDVLVIVATCYANCQVDYYRDAGLAKSRIIWTPLQPSGNPSGEIDSRDVARWIEGRELIGISAKHLPQSTPTCSQLFK